MLPRRYSVCHRSIPSPGPTLDVSWLKQEAQRRFCNRTSTNAHSWRLEQTQTRVFLGVRRSSGVVVSTSSRDARPFVRDPFKILFCGRDLFSCTVFREVYNAKDVWECLHIVTNPDTKTGRRGSRLGISPLKTVGETLGVPVHTIPEEKAAFRQWPPPPPFTPHPNSSSFQNFTHVLVTASFGRILPTSILRLFPEMQRLNVHPSLLPAYRGPAPIQRALIAGERETGVCVIEMGEVSRKAGKPVDAGDIWAVEQVHIPESAGFLHMQDTLAVSGGKLLVQVLRDMLSGEAQCRSQEVVTSTTVHAPVITARDSAIEFASQTADMIVRLERAIGHQRSLTVAAALPDGRGVAISGLRVIPAELRSAAILAICPETVCPGAASYCPETGCLVVKCAEGTWLSVERLQTQNRAMMAAKEWWNGVKGMGWVEDGVFSL